MATARDIWDREAPSFDDEPDHGLRDPAVRDAWRALLLDLAGPGPLRVLDVGCGTGSLSALLAEGGHAVTGIDISPAMLQRARAKVPVATFALGDAADPRPPGGPFDIVLCRHVLWALPDPAAALARWSALLAPAGRMILIEGTWHTGAGLAPDTVSAALPEGLREVRRLILSEDPAYWGGPVADLRYALLAGG